jgi:hypothetical protein
VTSKYAEIFSGVDKTVDKEIALGGIAGCAGLKIRKST